MARFWGLHHGVMEYNRLRSWEGKANVFKAIPFDPEMNARDVVYLFWGDECLYGWGFIEKLVDSDGRHQSAIVRFIMSRPPVASVQDEIKSDPLFGNWDTLKEEGCLSRFDDEQVRFLNALFPRKGLDQPPDLEDVRERSAPAPLLRPVVTTFLRGRQLQIVESRFDEFKTITSRRVVERILEELDEYVLGYLNLEDRRDETHCRIYWGIQDRPHVVVGITLSDAQRDELVRSITRKLSRIKPPIPPSSYYVQIHSVKDDSGNAITDLSVVEVAVATGEAGNFYCSENDSFYIRVENSTQKLTGQALLAEMRRRERGQTRTIPARATPAPVPSFSLRFNARSDYNRLRIKNVGNATARNVQIADIPLNNPKYPDKTIGFTLIPALQPDEEVPLGFNYNSFGNGDEQNRSGIHQDADVSQFLNNASYTMTLHFTDIHDSPYTQILAMDAGRFTPGPTRPA